MFISGFDNEYEKRINALAKMMQIITFGDLQFYDYVRPKAERTYSPEELLKLSGRHQDRIRKSDKKGNKIDTLACEYVSV